MPRPSGDKKPPSESPRSQLFIGAVERAFKVLEAFRDAHRVMSIAEIARSTGLDRSATQRLVHTMEHLGYLRRETNSALYALSPKVLEPSYNFLRSRAIVERASPYLLELSRALDETANLQELDGVDMVFLARFYGRHLLNVDTAVGYRLPAIYTASGRALLSKMSISDRRDVVSRTPLRQVTPYTEVDPKTLLAEIKLVAEKGYAIVMNQTVVGDISVAAAITDHHARPIAAIGVSVPSTRWTPEKAEEQLVPHVLLAASSLSKTIRA